MGCEEKYRKNGFHYWTTVSDYNFLLIAQKYIFPLRLQVLR